VRKAAAEGPNPVPVLRDTILSVVSAYTADDLLTPTGKSKLKQELLTTLRERVPAAHVVEVYFTEFLVQR
jgi:flagellar basal body-associated protein FliL